MQRIKIPEETPLLVPLITYSPHWNADGMSIIGDGPPSRSTAHSRLARCLRKGQTMARYPAHHFFCAPRAGARKEELMNFLMWIFAGLIAGWLAGQVMKGGGYGVVVDIILGILGGFVGGWLFRFLGFGLSHGFIGSIIVAFVGAVILVWLTRLLKKA